MKTQQYLLMLIMIVLTSACAKNVQASFPSSGGETGGLIVKFTDGVKNVAIVVDGQLLVDDAHTKRVFIANVPAGERKVVISGGGGGRKTINREETVFVKPDDTFTIIVSAPGLSSAGIIGLTLVAAISLLPWLFLL